jgi:C-terminal processing protease CtpA/Prc
VVSIQELVAGGLGEKAGLQAGSSITKINNEATNTLIINKQLKALAGKTFPITYQTSGSSAANTQQITCPEDQCMLGILMDTKNNLEIKPYKYDLPQSLEYARKEII